MESPPDGDVRNKVAGMDVHASLTEDPSAALWDFGDLLDFTVDDRFAISIDDHDLSVSATEHEIPAETSVSDRIRKRDPRLTCSNFLAGIVPCACPEMDDKLQGEEGAPGKKRSRTARSVGGALRCQVPGCEADIRELKGYHRRHKVCLRCANAATVIIDGETKRYCQQCGKFHILSDFDEGKRSCRRKLERHNNRRRRKHADSSVAIEDESQPGMQRSNVTPECETGKSIKVDAESLLESEDGQATTTGSAPYTQNVCSDSGLSVLNPRETPADEEKDSSKYSVSPPYHENKNAYSSMCPTGRISFKLYDWNPAEFPRRLRLQIFQWLANMPVELEGYIRPGCTILTVFIAMPKFMWEKLLEDPVTHLHNFVASPGRMLSGRGNMHIYLNNMIFRVIEGGNSVMKVNVEVRAPKLHYIHPLCFEAGEPIEFMACGSNLRQPKLRFLISFGGKYLACEYCSTWPDSQNGGDSKFNEDCQLYKIYISHTEPDLFGPAFVEVENQSGLSNFIPILVGDKETCVEMRKIENKLDGSLFSESCHHLSKSHEEFYTMKRELYSEIVTDLSWLIRKKASKNSQQVMSASQLQMFARTLKFLTQNESSVILERVIENIEILMEKNDRNGAFNGFYDANMRSFKKYMNRAKECLVQNCQKFGNSVVPMGCCCESTKEIHCQCYSKNKPISATGIKMGMEGRSNGDFVAIAGSISFDRSEVAPLLNKDVVVDVTAIMERPRKSCERSFVGILTRPRLAIFAITAIALCFGTCVAVFHPHRIGDIAVSIRRCFSTKFNVE